MTRALLEQALAALTYKGTSSWAKKRPAIEAIRAELAKPDAKPVQPSCWCTRCDLEVNRFRSHMAICPLCGDKRCPRAKDHRNECAKTAPPAWHDRPTQLGLWIATYPQPTAVRIDDIQTLDRVRAWPGRWFGPLPEARK